MERPALEQINLDNYPDGLRQIKDSYEKYGSIGKGAYGEVFVGRDMNTGDIVALNEVKIKNKGISPYIKREVDLLKMLHHENIVQLKEVVFSPGDSQSKGSLYMVFEYMNHDLSDLILNNEVEITVFQIKSYMKQLLTGLHYCHSNRVLHRDIKGDNILIDDKGNLKIADFGLARTTPSDPNESLTNNITVTWYRAPELLLGSCKYGPPADMWAAGVVFVHLLRRTRFLEEENATEQLNKLYEIFGSADETNWPGVSELPLYDTLNPQTKMEGCFKEEFKNVDQHAVNLLEKMLTLDPSKRISAKDALDDVYFRIDPLPSDPKRFNLNLIDDPNDLGCGPCTWSVTIIRKLMRCLLEWCQTKHHS